MRVLVAGCFSPFSGREEIHWINAIVEGLRDKKIEVDMYMLPFVQNPLLLPEQMMALRLMDTEERSDLLLTIGYPAFVFKHSHKRVLLFSLASCLHEWFDSEYGVLSTPQYQRIRRAVIDAERICLSEAERIFCASRTLATRINEDFNIQTDALILDDCLCEYEHTQMLNNSSWVVCESTLEQADRMDLLLYSVVKSNLAWVLYIFCPSASDVYYQAMHRRIERLGLKERVFLINGCLSPEVLRDASAYVAIPFATSRIPESAIRAVKSNVPIITTSDSDALLEITENEQNGLVVDPSTIKIAQAIDRLVADNKYKERASQINHQHPHKFSDINSVIKDLVE